MSGFQILFVEDDDEFYDAMVKLLKVDIEKLIGSSITFQIHWATNQAGAERAVQEAPPSGFDLILLDRKYPQRIGDKAEPLGDLWLPTLRKLQPHATIAILTSYAYEQHLAPAVQLVRDYDADEFIPKEMPWSKIIERLRDALRNRARQISQRVQVQPYESEIATTSAQDLAAALNLADSSLRQLGHVVSGSESKKLLQEVTQVFSELETRVTKIANALAGHNNQPVSEVDCAVMVKERALVFQNQIDSRLDDHKPNGRTIVVDIKNDCRIMTYYNDLQKALSEVLQNAVDAITEGRIVQPGAISITVDREEGGDACVISVLDRGPGFPPEALQNQFQSEHSYWPRGERHHKGMGLYVTRRLMHSIGGDIFVGNTKEGSAEVRLIVKDWGSGKQ